MRFISHQPSALLISSRAFNVYRPRSHEIQKMTGGQGEQGQFKTNEPGRKMYHTARTSNGLIVVAKSRKDNLVSTKALKLLEKQEQ